MSHSGHTHADQALPRRTTRSRIRAAWRSALPAAPRLAAGAAPHAGSRLASLSILRHGPARVAAAAVVLALCLGIFVVSAAYADVTFTVNSTADANDAVANGICETAIPGQCTLRAAVQEANGRPGTDTIRVPAGLYEIGIPVFNVDTDQSGDFDIYGSVIIERMGAGTVIIDGGFPTPDMDPEARGLDRLFEIHPTGANVTLRNLTLREGYSEGSGGAIQN